MSKAAFNKIPRKYRRALSSGRYSRLRNALVDESERNLLDSTFLADEKGFRIYQAHEDEKQNTQIRTLLKKIHKARSGPRTVRIVFLAILLGLPVIFNLFFLDRLAARLTEASLEAITRTDVGLLNYDIQPLKSRLDIRELSFASLTDPMMDALVFTDLSSDLSWKAFFHRRIGIDNLRGSIATNRARLTAANYPEKPEMGGKNAGVMLPDFSDILGMFAPHIPRETISSVESLTRSTKEAYDQWSIGLEDTYKEGEQLLSDIDVFLRDITKDNSDVQYWMEKVESARALITQAQSLEAVLTEYRTRLDNAADDAQNAFREIEISISADLAQIQSSLSFDASMLNRLVEQALLVVGGPKLERGYRQIKGMAIRLDAFNNSRYAKAWRDKRERDARAKKASRRMNQGRIVHFPVALPPRFTISNLRLSGFGVKIYGTNLGIDHDLAGAPSVLDISYQNESSPRRIAVNVSIDGRQNAPHLVSGSVSADYWPWELSTPDNSRIGGTLSSTAEFVSGTSNHEELAVSGHLMLQDWQGATLPMMPPSSDFPPLSVGFNMTIGEESHQLGVVLDTATIGSWVRVISEYHLRALQDSGGIQIPDELDRYLSDFKEIMNDWEDQGYALDALQSELLASEGILQKSIEDWAKKAAADLPLPDAGGLLDDLKSLF